jgi:predicted metal-binding protein
MTNREKIEEIITEFDICEYSFGKYDQIPFSDKVIYICQSDCPRYDHCWACPPAVGDIHRCMESVGNYNSFCLFSSVWEVSDIYDMDACLAVKKGHEALTRQLRSRVKQSLEDILVLSTGCTLCDKCTYPDEPCRHPEERLNSMESHGILLVNLLENMGMCSNYGNDMAVYFSMILFND